ncbi:OmpP1/FadL family transporter [Sphingopyxis sp. BSNA05]|uniref:OmpP1/FadL family transporter n=1 Tax=Sphingopyxis sp. BSNA05 TaxID=1236614 RepID=UPI0020B7E0D4|nr:outer membrane protein transport protein [Sphingopyxis sp. BSNA05]
MSRFSARTVNRPASSLASLLLASAALCMPSTAQATDGYFVNGVGAKSKGAGGVAIAMPQDAFGIATNPASATVIEHRLDVGFEIFIPDRGSEIIGNQAGLDGVYSGNDANPFILPEFAYVRPLSDTVSVGIAVNGNGGMNTDYKSNPFASFGATGPAGVNLRQISIAPTIAVEIAEGQSVGVSPHFVVQSFEANGIQPFAANSQNPGAFTNRGEDWAFGAGFRVGYLGSFGDNLRVGAFYQSKVWTTEFDRYAGLFAEQGGFNMPASWGMGVSVDVTPKLTLGADFKHIEYSDVNSVGNPIASLLQGVPFGADDGPGFGWNDIDVWKFGAVYQASDKLALRAGYGRSANPVPQSETLLNILAPGVVRDHFTLGATYKLSEKFEITGYAMRAPRQTVNGSGSIPAPFGGGEANIHLAETAIGFSLGFGF